MNVQLLCLKANCRAIYFTAVVSLLFILPSVSNAVAPPNWTINPANYQFRMDMVIRINYDAMPSNDPGNIVGVFVGPELRGVATPIDIGGQKYFFTTIYSNQYTGETLRFRAYYATPDDQVYSTNDSITFTNYAFVGNIANPYWINIDPNYDFPPEILPILADTTLQTIPFDKIPLADYLLSLDGDPVTWMAMTDPNLSVSFSGDTLSVQPVSPGWTGTDTVCIIVKENTPGQLADTFCALFTVLPDYGPPVWQNIPSQTIFGGGTFAMFDLDNYLTYNGPCREFELIFPSPYTSMTAPIVPVIAPDGKVTIQIIDPLWRGALDFDFVVWDCDFPTQRRDTTSATFSVVDDNNPHFTSPPTVSYREGACSELYDAQSVDPNDSEGNGLTYSIQGGADNTKFSIDPSTGKLTWFNFIPDFDNPGDANMDNQYEVTIRVTNLLNLTADLNLVVTVTQDTDGPFNPQLTGSNGTCIVGGSAMLQASGGVSYLWSTNATTPSITITNSGTYSVTITDSGGCTAVLSKTMNVAPTITASGNAGVVCNGTPILLTSTPAGGSGVYTTFAWDGPNSYVSNAQNPASIQAFQTATGTYTVTVTDNAGCTASATTVITVSLNSVPLITAQNNGPFCVGETISLSSTPSAGSGTYPLYSWAGPNTFSSTQKNPANFAAVLASAGTYTVTVTDSQGCTGTGTTTVVVNANPAIGANGNGPLCVGSMVMLGSTAIGGSGVYPNYSWAGPNMYTAGVQNPAPFPAILDASGTYTVTVTDNRGCSATSTVSVIITGKPTITATAVGPTCLGSSITLASTPAGGSGIYPTFSWTGPNMYSANVEDPAAFPGISAATGTYTVTVTDNANCSATASTTITVNSVPTINAGSNSPVCQGANLFLNSTPSGGSGVFTLFKWAGPEYVASIEDPAGFSTTLSSGGTYTVTVTDNNGCTGTATTQVTIVPKPTANATNNSPACIGTIVNLKVTPSGGTGTFTGFNWTGPTPFTSNVQNPPGFPAELASAGTYRVTVTDNAGCTATASITLAVQNNPAPSITAGSNSPLCPGATINLTSMPSGGSGVFVGYAWSGANGYSGTGQNPTGFTATLLSAGAYTVTVTDNRNCSNTASTTVVVDPPTITASNSGGCTDLNITLTSTPAGGSGIYTMYSWGSDALSPFTSNMQNPTQFPRIMAAQGTYTVTVTDNNGCTGTGTTYVQVGDIVPPTIDCPGDKTLNVNASCQATLSDWTSEATNLTDNCTAPASITVTQLPIPTTVISGHNTEQIVTLTADDGNMNTTPCTFKVTLKDVSKPVIQCPADQTVSADMNCAGTIGAWTLVSKMDNCRLSTQITEMQDLASGTPLNGHNSTTTVTLTANDGNGNTETCQFSVTLKDITPPVIQCPPNQTVSADANCQGQVGVRVLVSKMDNCTPSASITEIQSPMANTVLTGHNDFRTVTITAKDAADNPSSCQFTVTLKDVTPPMITCPNPTTVSCASDYPAPNTNLVTATDNCSVPMKTHVNDTPPYDIQCLNRFKRTRTYRATDAVGNSATCSQVITVYDGTAPTFTFVPANVTVQCNSIPAVGTPTATDNCAGPVTITYGQTRIDGNNCEDTYVLIRQWTASDICNNTRTATQRISVIDTQRPNFTSAPANVTVQCNAIPVVATPTATDNCDATVTITYNGQTKTNGTCLNNYILTRRWTASDNCSNTRSVSQRINVVDNGKPVFTSFPGDQTIECVDPIPGIGSPTATDACEGTVTVTYLGQSSANTLCPGLYQLKRTWRATDACGNSTASTQTITVADTGKPVFVSVPNHVTINCDQSPPPLENPIASDACGGYVQITFLGQVRTDSNCLYNYSLTRTWRADDLCGNTATATQVLKVIDVTTPVFTNAPADVTVTCANIPSVPTPINASDNCGSPTVTYQGETQGPGDCITGYTIQRTWLATDQCGNVKAHTQTITVQGSNFGPKTPPSVFNRPPTSINRQPSTVSLQPNPTTDRVLIGLSDFAGEAVTVSIFSDLGQLVWERHIPAVEDLSLSVRLREAGAATGIYTVRVWSKNDIAVQRLVLVE